MDMDAGVVCVRLMSGTCGEVSNCSDRSAVRWSSLGDSVSTPKSRLARTITTKGATKSAVCRRLHFDLDVDRDRQVSSCESSESVLDYVERLYADKVARWNMDFRTLTPLNGGRWRWTGVTASATTSQTVPADRRADDRCRSSASCAIAKKKRRRLMNGKRVTSLSLKTTIG